jgi:hypothetical protein
MMLTNEIEHYDCNSGIVLKLDKPKQNLLKDMFHEKHFHCPHEHVCTVLTFT